MAAYTWKSGTSFPVKADVAADAIKNLQTSLGKDTITAKELLDASRDENAPLHSCFEWDDSVAAEHYRQWQAGYLIRSLEVKISFTERDPVTVRAYPNIVPPNQLRATGQFTHVKIALQDPNSRRCILQRAAAELNNFKRKYAAFSELASVFAEIDLFAKSIDIGND